MALAGIAVLVGRRRTEGPARRRSLTLLVDSFVLALAMIALLGVTAVFTPEWSGFLTVQRVMFFTIGLAPLVFLIALLDERLGRSAVGELMVELQANPSPASLPDALGGLSTILRAPRLLAPAIRQLGGRERSRREAARRRTMIVWPR